MFRRSGKFLFLSLLLLHAYVILAFPYFVTQDGPSHLENANLLRLYSRWPLVSEYVAVNWSPVPNWFGHVVEAVLLQVFSAAVAEKIYLSLYAVLFVLAARCAMGRVECWWTAVPVFPLVFHCLFLYGFSNFCWGMCFFLVWAGFCSRRKGFGWRHWCAGAALGMVLYFSHLFAWVAAFAFTVCLAVERQDWRGGLRRASMLAPSLPLVCWFVWMQRGVAGSAAAVPAAVRWTALWRALTLVFSYDRVDALIASAFGILLLALAGLQLIRRRWNAWTVMAGLFAAAYFVSPPQSGIGQYVLERWNLYVLLAMVMWVAVETRNRWEMVAVAAAATVISGLLVWRVAGQQRAVNEELAEYLSVASAVERGSTILAVQFDSRGGGPLRSLYGFPMRHAASYLAVERGAVNLDNYEAQTDVFPLIFRAERNPGVFIGHMEDEPPTPQFAGYGARTGGRVDYVLVWDPLGNGRERPAYAAIRDQLGGYSRVAASAGDRAVLYRRR